MASQGWKLLKNQASKTVITAVIFCGLAATVIFYIISYWSSTHLNPFTYKNNADTNNKDARITKRTTDNTHMFDYYSNCIVDEPSEVDIRKLCTRQECATIPCVQFWGPEFNNNNNNNTNATITTCFTKACATFKVINADKKTTLIDVDLSQLSNFVNTHVSQFETAKNAEVICSDKNSHLFDKKLEVEIIKDTSHKHTLGQVSDSNDDSKSNPEINFVDNPKLQIYLIYFRFMSKWESFLKLPRLNGFIENKRNDKLWDIHSFERVQSQSFVLVDNLRSVLGLPGESADKGSKENLVQRAKDSGFCVSLNVLACQKSEAYSKIEQAIVTENNTRNCNKDKYEQPNIQTAITNTNQSLCENNSEERDIDKALYINERLENIYSTTSSNIFSISIINVPDVSSSNVLDTSVAELVTRIVSSQSNVLILMSDVGDPKFSRFDESIFLRTQSFNPLLHVWVSRTISRANPGIPRLVSDLRMKEAKFLVTDISDVHGLTKAFIFPGEKGGKVFRTVEKIKTKNESDVVKVREDTSSNGACPGRRIKGPIECMCLGNHVRFPNDSVQSAFASLVVGSLNNKLQDVASTYDFRVGKMISKNGHSPDMFAELSEDGFTCDRLIGTSFKSVYHVLWKNSTYILMTLHLLPTSRRNSRAIRIDVEVEYTTDNSYNTIFSVNILHPTKVPLSSLSGAGEKPVKKLIHILCQPPNELNVDKTSHREYLNFISSENHFGMKVKTKGLHHPCLFLVTRTSGDSTSVDVVNVCDDRVYNVTVSAQLINVMSLTALPVEATLGPLETRYVSTLVKIAYVVTRSIYKINTFYTVMLI